MKSLIVASAVVVAVVALVLFLPAVGEPHRTAQAGAETAIPVGTFGGLGLSALVSARMVFTRRNGTRRRDR